MYLSALLQLPKSEESENMVVISVTTADDLFGVDSNKLDWSLVLLWI